MLADRLSSRSKKAACKKQEANHQEAGEAALGSGSPIVGKRVDFPLRATLFFLKGNKFSAKLEKYFFLTMAQIFVFTHKKEIFAKRPNNLTFHSYLIVNQSYSHVRSLNET